MIRKTILSMVLIVLLSCFSFAVEEFSAGSSSAELSFCSLTNQEDSLVVINTGDSFSDYTVTVSGSAAPYTTAFPLQFSLMPGEHQVISLFYHIPKGDEGRYALNMNIRTGFGLEKSIQKKISASLCNNNVLLAHNFNQTACPCLDMVYDFTIQNPGPNPETYLIGLDKEYAQYANVSQNPVYLMPGEAQDVSLTFTGDCAEYGSKVLTLYSNAQGSGITASLPLLANIDHCYDYQINTGSVVANTNQKNTSAFFAQQSTYNICGGDNSSIQIQLDNIGYIGNNFEYELDGPQWGVLSKKMSSLSGFENEIAFLDVTPPLDLTGDFSFVINAMSQLGSNGVQKEVNVQVNDCHDIEVDLVEEDPICNCLTTSLPLTIQNNGAFVEDVLLSIDGPEFANLSAASIRVGANNVSFASVDLSPACDLKTKESISISAILANGKAQAQDSVSFEVVPIQSCYDISIMPEESLTVVFERSEIPILIEHKGSKAATYTVSMEAPSWVSLDTQEFSLGPNEHHTILLIADPTNEQNLSVGNYDVKLSMQAQNVAYQKNIQIKLRNSESVLDQLSQAIVFYRYWVISGLIILVILLVIALFVRKQMKVWKIKRLIVHSVREDKAQREAKPAKKAVKKEVKKVEAKKVVKKEIAAPKEEARSLWPWIIGGAIVLFLIVLSILIAVFAKGVFGFIGGFLQIYLWYIIIGIVLLGVIIFVLSRMDKK